MATESSLKRPLDTEDTPSTNKKRRLYKHHHSVQPLAASIEPREPAFVDPETADKLLLDAIKAIVEEEGAKLGNYDPIIESLALTALRNAVEECMHSNRRRGLSGCMLTIADMLKFCSKVRRSMQAARRTIPIAPDFESAIAALDVPQLEDQIKAYQTKRVTNPVLLPTPPPEDSFHRDTGLPASLLGPELDVQASLKAFHHRPNFLPPLPSAHTYKSTNFFPKRETDSRRIRELATEEGKLGEQALRKLAGAVKLDAAHPVDPETHEQALSAAVKPRLRKQKRKSVNEAALFEDTMRDLLMGEPDGFELGPLVTSEKVIRMPDDGQLKRRPRAEPVDKSAETGLAPPNAADGRMEGVEVMEF